MIIRNGGDGATYGAQVSSDGRLLTKAVTLTELHDVSEHEGQAYSVVGITDTLTSATIPILHFKNTSSSKHLEIDAVWFQTVDGGGTLPATGIYFGVGFGRTYSSVGTLLTPTNLNTGSGNTAEATIYHSTPVLAGTNVEIWREYIEAEAKLVRFDPKESIFIAPNDTVEFYVVTTETTGNALCTVIFHLD